MVCNAKASLPLCDSDKQKALIVLVANRGNHISRCGSVPHRRIALMVRVLCISTSIATLGSIRAISSMTIIALVKFNPAPPTIVSGTSIPMYPNSNRSCKILEDIAPFVSISRTTGSNVDCPHCRTVSRIMISSSVKVVIGNR